MRRRRARTRSRVRHVGTRAFVDPWVLRELEKSMRRARVRDERDGTDADVARLVAELLDAGGLRIARRVLLAAKLRETVVVSERRAVGVRSEIGAAGTNG